MIDDKDEIVIALKSFQNAAGYILQVGAPCRVLRRDPPFLNLETLQIVIGGINPLYAVMCGVSETDVRVATKAERAKCSYCM